MNNKIPGAAPLPNPFAARMLLGTYIRFHLQALLFSLGQIWRAPIASILTAIAMGISLALPTALEVLVKQIGLWSSGIQRSAQVTLFLKGDVGDIRAQQLTQSLRKWPELTEVRYVSSAMALEEFRQTTGIDEILDILEQNPLPAQIRLTPKISLTDRLASTNLTDKLKNLPEVQVAEMDLHWLQRLDTFIELSWRLLLILSLLFGLAVLAIATNSIRLSIDSQGENIAVAKLVGATNAYIRRPFLYSGLWFGFSSGLVAWVCVYTSLWYLQAPAARLAGMFNQELSLLYYGITAAKVIPIACCLGWLGARIGTSRYLKKLDPV